MKNSWGVELAEEYDVERSSSPTWDIESISTELIVSEVLDWLVITTGSDAVVVPGLAASPDTGEGTRSQAGISGLIASPVEQVVDGAVAIRALPRPSRAMQRVVDGQERADRALVPSTFGIQVQVGEAAVASVVAVDPPLKSAVRQTVVDGQSIWFTDALDGPGDEVQVGVVLNGLVVRYLFAPADATHSVVAGQETPSTNPLYPMFWTAQVGEAAVASVVVMTFPLPPLATHSVVEGQEMLVKEFSPSDVAGAHVGDEVRFVTVVK